MTGRLTLLLLAVVLAGCGGTAAPTPIIIYVTPAPTVTPAVQATLAAIATLSPSPEPTPAPADEPITVEGSGTKNTAPIELAGGDYVVSWETAANSDVGCYHSASLEGLTDASYNEGIGSHLLSDKGPFSDQTNIYGVPAGRYFVNVISGCDWTITIAPA